MSIDEDIITKADNWEKEKQKTERERIKLSHERRVSIGRFIKNFVLYVGGATLICGGLFFGIRDCNASCEAEKMAEIEYIKKQESKNKVLDVYYDKIWEECVIDIGIDKCNSLMERGVHELCETRRVRRNNKSFWELECNMDRINFRYEMLKEENNE